jgi:dihydrodipicolinate reductase
MKGKDVIVIGRGKLSEKIQNDLPKYISQKNQIQSIKAYNPTDNFTEDTVFVHVGSGREYGESLNIASMHNSTYIQGATEKDYSLERPKDESLKYIYAPNLNIQIVKFLYWLKLGRDLFTSEKIQIKESHQKEKQSVPGTAIKMCDLFGIDKNKIISIRDPEIQKTMNIMDLSQHAFHEILIGNNENHIKLETNITGLASYVEGLSKIISILPFLKTKNYELEDLIDEGLL